MRAKIALVLAVVMIFTVSMPSFVFGADNAGLEDAIKKVKSLFDIPESFKEFNYSVNTVGDKKVWDLNWNSKDGAEGSITARVDSKGDVLGYFYYRYMDYGSITTKLPKISREEAKKKAEEIIKKVSPDTFDSLQLIEDAQTSLNDQFYYFNYVRTYNNILFPLNRITIAINRQTGELQNYSKEWSDNLSFPSSDKAIDLKAAQEAYIKNLGLRLTYNLAIDKEDMRVYAAYTPVFNSNYYIDAFTGEKVYLGGLYYGGDMEKAKYSMDQAAKGGMGDVVLTPEEINAVEEASKLIDQEKAEKIARDLKVLELDDTYTLERASLHRSWPLKTGFTWNLYFSKGSDQEGKESGYISVIIDAMTSEVKGFSVNYPQKGDVDASYDKAAAKKAAEKFLREIQPDKFKETEYDEVLVDGLIYRENEAPKYYSFRYIRKVNGVLFPNNGLTVAFDAVAGKITSYSLDWYNVEFPSVDKVIALEDIYDVFFNDVGLKLQYYLENPDIAYIKKAGIDSGKKQEVKLVYAVNTQKPAIFDANTGAILDYDGKPYKEKKAMVYTDISGHYAEQKIKVLAEIGIGLEGPEFKPGEKIKQKDFLLLISQVINSGYEFYGKTALTSEDETENLYRMLIREGIVKEDEKNPEAALTREDSVKFVIRALKYNKVAELGDIFNCTFKDKDQINPSLIGHVVIAKGLGIVNGYGDYFRPKAELTRADALIIIYNYLQI
ncbi:MAG: S-layer homology domain-containing protein [Bacillota bacterium]